VRTSGAMRALTAGTNGARVIHHVARTASSATARTTIVRTRRRDIASIVAPHQIGRRQTPWRDHTARLVMLLLQCMQPPIRWPLCGGQVHSSNVGSGSKVRAATGG